MVSFRSEQSGESAIPARKQRSDKYNRAIYGLIFTTQKKQVIEVLSAAKAPKGDGKGNSYVEVISSHMPILEAVQTASRKAFKKALVKQAMSIFVAIKMLIKNRKNANGYFAQT